MVDDPHVISTGEPIHGSIEAGVPDTGSVPAATQTPVADHPHAGVPEQGWSLPDESQFGRLIVKRGGAETDIEFPVAPPCVIGRFDPAVGPVDIDLGSLPEGSYVSRKHAKICWENGWKIEDLGSSNGTFLLRNDFERVTEAELKDGDEIALGNARFVFHIQSPS